MKKIFFRYIQPNLFLTLNDPFRISSYIKRNFFRCGYGAHYAVARKLDHVDVAMVMNTIGKLYIFYRDKPYLRKTIPLIDSRLETPKHQLAVCTSLLSRFDDWIVLVRFFEVAFLYTANVNLSPILLRLNKISLPVRGRIMMVDLKILNSRITTVIFLLVEIK